MNDDRDDPRQPLRRGARLQEYVIEKVLGQGGFGITYRVVDNLDRKLAIKEYFPAEVYRDARTEHVRANGASAQEAFAQGLRRFLGEAAILAQLKHPNIIGVLRYFEANGTAYLVMDYERGETLAELLANKRQGLDCREIQRIFLPLLEGVSAIHAKGLAHLDIKPENIFLREDGTPVLIDFGGARKVTDSDGRTLSSMVFMDGYSPIEQYTTKAYQGSWSDIYALGATIYHCMFGKPPVGAQERSLGKEEDDCDPLIPAAQRGAERYPPAMLEAVDHALVLSRKGRLASTEKMRALLAEDCASRRPAAASDPKPVTDPPPRPDSGPVTDQPRADIRADRSTDAHSPHRSGSSLPIFGAGIVVVLLMGAGVIFFWRGGEGSAPPPPPPLSVEATCNGRLSGQEIRRLVSGHTALGRRIDVRKPYDWKEYQEPGGGAWFRKVNGRVAQGRWKIQGDRICWCYGTCQEWKCKYVEAENDCGVWYYVDAETGERTGRISGWAHGDRVN